MELHRLMSAFDYKITDGDKYLWKCYPDARIIYFESNDAYASVIHCTKTSQVVYEVTVERKNFDEPVYRWINLNFLDAYLAECVERNFKSTIVQDELLYIDEFDPDKFMIKVTEVFKNTLIK